LAKAAVAHYHSLQNGKTVSEDDIIIASGASGAINLAIEAVINEGNCFK
jgi:aspartate/methionine/tyrosine aminotransferase